MKKLIIICVILTLSGLSCKKICACSPSFSELFIVIRNSAGDLLNPVTPGHYAKSQIEFYRELASGDTVRLKFDIAAPRPKGNSPALNYYQFHVGEEAVSFANGQEKIYLKLGSGQPKLIKLKLKDNNVRYFSELTIGNKTIPADKYYLRTLFYYTP